MSEKPELKHRKPPRGSLAIDEIHKRYDGEYVLLHVTEFDEIDNPARGKILCHSPDRDEVSRAVPSARDRPGPLYVFYAEPRIRSGPEYIKAMEEFVARVNARLEEARRGLA